MSIPTHRRLADQFRAGVDNLDRSVWFQYPVGGSLTWSLVTHPLQVIVSSYAKGMRQIVSENAAHLRIVNIWAWSILVEFDKAFCKHAASRPPLARPFLYVIIYAPLLISWVLVLFLVDIFATVYLIFSSPLSVTIGFILYISILIIWLIWLAFYQYPLFGIVYPKVRSWISNCNSQVYRPLSANDQPAQVIRVVRLKAGKPDQAVECILETENLIDAYFEALSYVWGTTIMPYKITVNDQPFYVSYNLFTALQQLRYTENDRVLWIDAISINQSNIPEKNSQVQLMRDIYSKASTVIVWLGKESLSISAAFKMARAFAQANDEQHDSLWKKTTSNSDWKSVRKEWRSILQHDWWTRVWIIQEAVVCSRVSLQRGCELLDWDHLQQLLTVPHFRREFEWKRKTIHFASYLEELRTDIEAGSMQTKTLFDLAWNFRYQSATLGSDKLYALQGLLHGSTPIRLIPDYNKRPEQVFVEFSISCVEQRNDLLSLSLVEGMEVPSVSWCRDWRFNRDGFGPTRSFAMHPPRYRNYSASGDLPVWFAVDIKRCILSLRGFEVDRIAKTCSTRSEAMVTHNSALAPYWYAYQCWNFLLGWERDAGGPWAEPSNSRRAFNRTITADCWDGELTDWKSRLSYKGVKEPKEENTDYRQCIDDACLNRRFFITQSGRLGLGPAAARKGDLVCILLGGRVPFILRKINEAELDKARVRLGTSNPVEYHRLIGETYCDGLMYREGSLEEDLADENILPMEYHIL